LARLEEEEYQLKIKAANSNLARLEKERHQVESEYKGARLLRQTRGFLTGYWGLLRGFRKDNDS
jgi:multidrug resistance efflux pump